MQTGIIKSRLSNKPKMILQVQKDTIDRPGQILLSWLTRIHAPLPIWNMGTGKQFQFYRNQILLSTPLHFLRCPS